MSASLLLLEESPPLVSDLGAVLSPSSSSDTGCCVAGRWNIKRKRTNSRASPPTMTATRADVGHLVVIVLEPALPVLEEGAVAAAAD